MNNKNDLYRVPIVVSILDVANDPIGNKAIRENNTKLLEEYLDRIGFDLEFGWEMTESIEHRCESLPANKSFFGPRIAGIEKQTEQWLKHGNPSTENLIEAKRDPSLRAELKQIGAYPHFSEWLIADAGKVNKQEIEEKD